MAETINQQHINPDAKTDADKGAELGGVGGAVTGAVAGAVAGPVGMVAGAIIGGVAGAVGSRAAVGAVDKVDDDNTVSGIGAHTGHVVANEATAVKDDVNAVLPGNKVPGVQTGGHAYDGTPDTRGVTEKIADAVTGDHIDDKTGKPV